MNGESAEERLALLLRELPPAPPAWIALAAELPAARVALDHIDRDVLDHAAERRAQTAELEAALERVDIEATPARIEALRRLAGER